MPTKGNAVNHRHHPIGNNQIRMFKIRHAGGCLPIQGKEDTVSFCLQQYLQGSKKSCVVVNQQDRFHSCGQIGDNFTTAQVPLPAIVVQIR